MKKNIQQTNKLFNEEKRLKTNLYQQKYRKLHHKKLTARRLAKKDELNRKKRERYQNDPEYRKQILLANERRVEQKPEMRKRWARTSYLKNKEKISKQHKEYYQANKEKAKIYAAEWYQKNKKLRNKQEYDKYHTDPLYKITRALRSVIRNAFKRIGKNKPTNTEHLMGCSWIEAKVHFESLFKEGMSWKNYGEWHIDHIRPCSSFTEKDMHEMNHISNLQPLWAEENIQKSDSFDVWSSFIS